MTIDYREFFAERVEPFFVEYVQPVVRNIGKTVVSAVKFSFGAALTLAASGFLILASYGLSLPDATMMMQNGGQPASDTRVGLLILSAIALGVLIYGLRVLYDWFRPRENRERVADLEIKLRAAEAELFEAEQFAQAAGEAEWMREALGVIEDVFHIPGVCAAARKAARRATHPDSYPGASEQELREHAERFQMCEAVFSRFQPN
jgi:hypothetical protein